MQEMSWSSSHFPNNGFMFISYLHFSAWQMFDNDFNDWFYGFWKTLLHRQGSILIKKKLLNICHSNVILKQLHAKKCSCQTSVAHSLFRPSWSTTETRLLTSRPMTKRQVPRRTASTWPGPKTSWSKRRTSTKRAWQSKTCLTWSRKWIFVCCWRD